MHWRDEHAGAELSQADVEQFAKTCFKSTPRMANWDYVKEFEHMLCAGLGKSLAGFKLSKQMHIMSPGSVIYQYKGKWYRGVPTLDSNLETAPNSDDKVEMPTLKFPREDI